MDVNEAIAARYSCRHYQDKTIESDKLNCILEAARLAPSARNMQDWRFVVVQDAKTKQRLAEAANHQMFIAQAGVIIVGCNVSDYVMRCGQAVAPINVAIALDHMSLQATELGMATCWIGSFFPEKIRQVLAIPSGVVVVELLAVGYPADQRTSPLREPLENIVCFEAWDF
ncbi:nitroreductase family protein [Planctomycetota bacterium]